jgi:hypothetical protein
MQLQNKIYKFNNWSVNVQRFLFLSGIIVRHKHVETNRRVAEPSSYSLQYHSFVETPVHQRGQICCRMKNITFE